MLAGMKKENLKKQEQIKRLEVEKLEKEKKKVLLKNKQRKKYFSKIKGWQSDFIFFGI